MEQETVILVSPKGEEREFSKEHAERLMGMQENGGWKRKRKTSKTKTKASAAKKRDSKPVGSKTKAEDDCGCSGT